MKIRLMVPALMLGIVVVAQGQARDQATELRNGQAILRPRYDKDEAAFKAIHNPSPEAVKAEQNMQRCFAVARSTEGMYHVPKGQGMKPNCDREFTALEKAIH